MSIVHLVCPCQLLQRGLFLFDLNEKVGKAETIVVLGGGTGGVELCGEIASVHKGKGKRIVLLHKHERLMMVPI